MGFEKYKSCKVIMSELIEVTEALISQKLRQNSQMDICSHKYITKILHNDM